MWDGFSEQWATWESKETLPTETVENYKKAGMPDTSTFKDAGESDDRTVFDIVKEKSVNTEIPRPAAKFSYASESGNTFNITTPLPSTPSSNISSPPLSTSPSFLPSSPISSPSTPAVKATLASKSEDTIMEECDDTAIKRGINLTFIYIYKNRDLYFLNIIYYFQFKLIFFNLNLSVSFSNRRKKGRL